MHSIIQEIKQRFKIGDILTRLIYINIGVFLFLILSNIILKLIGTNFSFSSWLALNTSIPILIVTPWTIITHMFVHEGVFHILGNMMMLYFLGKLFLMYFNPKQLLALYFLGGLIGAGFLLLIVNISPIFNDNMSAVGASAAVMAISIAVCTYRPNQEVFLFGMFKVALKWLGLALILIDLLTFFNGNTGGHIAHLGGAFTGYWFATAYKQGKDITKFINKFLDFFVGLFDKKSKLTVEYRNNARNLSDEDYNYYRTVTQEKIDAILDKISSSGYESLSKEEKDMLFKYSKKK
jgi:membrane associated rhomboid family serine protease